MSMETRAGILHGSRQPERQPRPAARALITREGERALSGELARLRQQLGVEFPQRLREALSFGEAQKNDDYLQAKEEEAVVASRLRQLETVLAAAEVVEAPQRTDGRVTVGSTVQVEDLASGRTSEHLLAGTHERLAPTDVSANSPIGQALLGREAEDEVSVDLPSGRSVDLRISSVR
jgi:transcription elongation factor GreA